MIGKEAIKAIEQSAAEIITRLGFELIEFRAINSSGNLSLRFIADRPEGGISLGECAQLNHHIGKVIEENNILNEKYALEVFSPGLDRPLLSPNDFRRAKKKEIHIFLKEEKDGKLEFEGEVLDSNSEGVFIKKDNNELFIPFLIISQAKQVIL
jgi:ribosome maturation factor RimP